MISLPRVHFFELPQIDLPYEVDVLVQMPVNKMPILPRPKAVPVYPQAPVVFQQNVRMPIPPPPPPPRPIPPPRVVTKSVQPPVMVRRPVPPVMRAAPPPPPPPRMEVVVEEALTVEEGPPPIPVLVQVEEEIIT